ncbi:CLIP domain-containing serine protease B8-like [Wyeomyia smithii]|uniref:CLIP domain-containing serine protease B8-like n=1 Tax=Wyeomyia smithii TaxID=174621 RepID=UPI002467E566|nr:CLIP domain-containing serine protease B8-like [Wyeomyia smithii]
MNRIVGTLSVLFVTAALVAGQFPPIWDVTTSCNIPNEPDQGACQNPDDCFAYQHISDVDSLSSVGRLSFLRGLQCTGMAEGMICCPRHGSAYRQPKMNESLPKRDRGKSTVVVSRMNADTPCGHQSYNEKVLGGQITNIDEFPWTAMLLYGAKGTNEVAPACGGALISKSFVITAAHCLVGQVIQNKGPLKFVRLGEYDLNKDPDCLVDGKFEDCTDGKVDIKPKRILPHPQYAAKSSSQHHDIGLVQLEKPVVFTDFIQHICLPEATADPAVGAKLNVCGWGRTDFFRNEVQSNVASPIKLKVALPIVDHQRCRDIYRPHKLALGSGQLCAGGHKAKDSCFGDSGSPLMFFDNKKGTWILSGVVSIGVQKCGTEGQPGIYTNVREYLGWIKKNTV